MHKYAGELQRGDKFTLAAVHFEIVETYELDVDNLIRIAFVPLSPNVPTNFRNKMDIDRSILFCLL